MVVTNSAERADKLRCLRSHGSKTKNYHKVIGGNFRLDTLQAALVLAKLEHLDAWTVARQYNATRYARLFSEAGVKTAETAVHRKLNSGALRELRAAGWDNGMPEILLPSIVTDRPVFHQYVIRVADRDQLKVTLDRKGVGNGIYYPVPISPSGMLCLPEALRRRFPREQACGSRNACLTDLPRVARGASPFRCRVYSGLARYESRRRAIARDRSGHKRQTARVGANFAAS